MIWLTRLDGSPFLLNEDRIVTIEGGHDTMLALAGGERIRVQESCEEIMRRILDWQRRVAIPGILGIETEPE